MAIHGHIAQVVPEPATAWLLVTFTGIAGLSRRIRIAWRN
jgi:hypothetical protein